MPLLKSWSGGDEHPKHVEEEKMKWEIDEEGSLKSNKTNISNYMQDPFTSLGLNTEECQIRDLVSIISFCE